MSNTFNIFKVLEKDDKELIHSSFLRFLMNENNCIYEDFFGIKGIRFDFPTLEKSYKSSPIRSGVKSERKRIDIEAISLDKKHIVIIENKFKSFPYKKQLTSYDDIYDKHHKDKQKHKFLLCFDKNLVSFKTDWKVFDYKDLLTFIENHYFKHSTGEKLTFIKHFHSFLNDYYQKYTLLVDDSRPLFVNLEDNENKFWLRLFYSALHLKLDNYFATRHISVRFDLNPGSTNVPLINIIPSNWNLKGKELLIQFQGGDIKFYSHSNDRVFIEELVQLAKQKFISKDIEFKNLTKREAGSYFVFKTKLTTKIGINQKLNLSNIKQTLINFYNEIDQKIIKQLLH